MPDVSRILIVRPSALGDVCRTVPCLVSLRRAYPRAKIDWLVRREFAPAVACHPMLDAVVAFDRRGGARSWLALSRDLRRRGYDMVFDLQGLARSAWFTWATRAAVRVGPSDAREMGWLAYNARVKLDPAQHVHAVDRMMAVVCSQGAEPVVDMRLYVDPADDQWREQRLGGEPYAVLAPTSRWASKNWPLERYAEVGRRLLAARADWRIVVLASPSEHAAVRPLVEALPTDRVLCPTTSVGQMLAMIKGAQYLLANDSAALHAAVGFDRPFTAIFGPTDPAKVGPYGHGADVLTPEHHVPPAELGAYRRPSSTKNVSQAINSISVDRVWSHACSRLNFDP